jgi:hypothetical protein
MSGRAARQPSSAASIQARQISLPSTSAISRTRDRVHGYARIFSVLDADPDNHLAAGRIWQNLIAEREELISSNYISIESFAPLPRRLGLAAVGDVVGVLQVRWVDEQLHAAGVAALQTAGRRQLSVVIASASRAHASPGSRLHSPSTWTSRSMVSPVLMRVAEQPVYRRTTASAVKSTTEVDGDAHCAGQRHRSILAAHPGV